MSATPARRQDPAPDGAVRRANPSSSEVLALQRAVGNATVDRLLHRTAPAAADQGSNPQAVLGQPGRPLAANERADMESRFGAHFSDVRLHTGPAARRSAAELGARAYTSGSHVVIGDGGADQATLAHELTHVLQQRSGPVPGAKVGGGLRVSDPGDEFERAAERTAALVLGSRPRRAATEHPVHGEPRPPQGSPAVPGPVQRVLVTQVHSDDSHTITDLTVAGRPESPYKGTMGDHSTAFVVQVDAVRRCVVGSTPDEAAEALDELYAKTTDMPGVRLLSKALRHSEHRRRFDAACSAFEARYKAFKRKPESSKVLEIQLLVDDFLNARELLPLTTINIKAHDPALAGKGHGESAEHRTLFDHANGGEQSEAEVLREAVWKLLDSRGVALVATEVEAHKLATMAPGLRAKYSSDKRIAILVKQHLASIKLAYPGVIDDAWSDLDTAARDLTSMMREPVRERREKNKADYLKLLEKCSDRARAIVQDLSNMKKRKSGDFGRLAGELDKEARLWDDLTAVVEGSGGVKPKKPSLEVPEDLGKRVRKKRKRLIEQDEPERLTGKKRKRTSSPDEAGPSGTTAEPAEAPVVQTEQDEEEATERVQTLAVQIVLDDAGKKIKELRLAGRSPSPFSGTMGAHTTAWAVHVDAIRARLQGRRVGAAMAAVRELAKEAQDMLTKLEAGNFTAGVAQAAGLAKSKKVLDGHLEELFKAPYGSPARLLLLQRCVGDLLTMINYMPGVSLEATDTGGKGEGTIRTRLLRFEAGEDPYDGDDLGKRLMRDLLGMLDIREVGKEEQREVLMRNHQRLVTMAYPKAAKRSGLERKNPSELLGLWVDHVPVKRGTKRPRTFFW